MHCEWEHIICSHAGLATHLYRTKVPGGWLVQVQNYVSSMGSHIGGLTFYPDPQHEWDGNSMPLANHEHVAEEVAK